MLFGASIVFGAIEYNVGWDERGPEPGYFPFWMGLLVIVGSIGTLFETILKRHDKTGTALTWTGRARRPVRVADPRLSRCHEHPRALRGDDAYLFTVMVLHGGYRVPSSLAVSVGSALVFYVLFDKWLRVPLMKGPIEAWLGIY